MELTFQLHKCSSHCVLDKILVSIWGKCLLLSRRIPQMCKGSNTIEVSAHTHQVQNRTLEQCAALSSNQGQGIPGSFHIVAPYLQPGASKVSVLLIMKPQKGKEWMRAPRKCFWARPGSSPQGFCSPFIGQSLVTEPHAYRQGWETLPASVPRKKRQKVMGTELHISSDVPWRNPPQDRFQTPPPLFLKLPALKNCSCFAIQ